MYLFEASENFTCAPGIGLFEMVTDRLNYSNAMIACEDNGGHLANIVSDPRTSFLTTLVSSVLVNQTVGQRKAFVGLFFENEFITITGKLTLLKHPVSTFIALCLNSRDGTRTLKPLELYKCTRKNFQTSKQNFILIFYLPTVLTAN